MNKRKLIKYLLLTLFAVMLATGCSKSVEIQDVSGESEDEDSQYEQADESGQEEDAAEEGLPLQSEEIDKNSGETTEQKSTKTDLAEGKAVASVIVKSENNLSDSEKQEIVDQLSKEVDDLLNEINSVE